MKLLRSMRNVHLLSGARFFEKLFDPSTLRSSPSSWTPISRSPDGVRITRRTVPRPLRLTPKMPLDEKSNGTSASDSPSRVMVTIPAEIGESKDSVTRAIPEAGVGVGSDWAVTVAAPVERVARVVVGRARARAMRSSESSR